MSNVLNINPPNDSQMGEQSNSSYSSSNARAQNQAPSNSSDAPQRQIINIDEEIAQQEMIQQQNQERMQLMRVEGFKKRFNCLYSKFTMIYPPSIGDILDCDFEMRVITFDQFSFRLFLITFWGAVRWLFCLFILSWAIWIIIGLCYLVYLVYLIITNLPCCEDDDDESILPPPRTHIIRHVEPNRLIIRGNNFRMNNEEIAVRPIPNFNIPIAPIDDIARISPMAPIAPNIQNNIPAMSDNPDSHIEPSVSNITSSDNFSVKKESESKSESESDIRFKEIVELNENKEENSESIQENIRQENISDLD